MKIQLVLTWMIFCSTLSFTIAGNFSKDIFAIPRRYGVMQHNSNINYEQVLNFWNEHNKDFVFHDELKDVVLVMGNTGAGKSTLVSALVGRKLRVTKSKGYLKIVDDEDRIGTGVSSKTLVPEIMNDFNRSVKYIDCAGFRDNRDLEFEISSLYFQNIMLNQVDRIKLLFVINYDSLKVTGNKNDFDDLLERISEFIKDVSKFRDGIALVATKVENTYEEDENGNFILSNDNESVLEGIVEYLNSKKDVYQSRTVKQGKYRMFVNLIDTLLQKNNQTYTRIAIFRQPSGQGLLEKLPRSKKEIDTITKMIVEDLSYVKKQTDDFGLALSQSAKIAVDKIIDDIFRKALTSRINEMSNGIITHYLQLETQYSDIRMLHEQTVRAYDLISRIENVSEPKELFEEFIKVTNTMNISVSYNNLNIISDNIKALNFFTTISNTNGDLYLMLLKNKAQSVIDWISNFKNIYKFMNNVNENLCTYEVQKLKNDKRIQDIIMNSCESVQDKIIGDITNLESIVNEIGLGKIYQTIKTMKMNQSQLKRLEQIFSGFAQKLESSCTSEQMTVKGYNVRMKDVIEIDCFPQAKIIQIFALNKIFIDSSIDKTGKETQLFIFAPTWEVNGKPKIILDGTPGEKQKVEKAKSAISNSYSGTNGEPGLPGGSAGHFFGTGKQFISLENLEVHASGGNGGPGQHGGDGADGSTGEEVPESFHSILKSEPCVETIQKYLNEHQFKFNTSITTSMYTISDIVVWVNGKPAKKPTNGGNGGYGGQGGYPGKIIINGLGKSVTFKVFNQTGSIGLMGQGGVGGKGKPDGRNLEARGRYSKRYTYVPCSHYEIKSIKYLEGETNPDAPNGKPGVEDKEKQKLPKTIPIAGLPFVINSFKAFVRKHLFENIKEFELLTLLFDIENDKQIRAQYNTLAFVKELEILENQSLELRSKIEFDQFYDSFLNRIEEFAMTEKVMENKKVLSYTYTSALTKVFTLRKKRKGKTVVNLTRYLSTIESTLEDIRDAQNLQTVIKYRNDYETTLRNKIGDANDFIENKIEPEINKLLEDSDNQVDVIIQVIKNNQKSTKQAISSLEKYREEIRNVMQVRSILLPLKLAATCLSFAGPVGASVGATITGATSITEGLVPNPTQGHKPVYSLDPNLKIMSRISDVLNNKPQKIAEKLDVVVKTLDKQKEDLYTSQKEKIEISEKIGQLKAKTDEIKNRRVGNIADMDRRKKDAEKLEQEINVFIESRKTVLGKEKAALDTIKKEDKNAEQLKKEMKLEKTLRGISNVQTVLNSVESVFGFVKKMQNDNGRIDNIDKQISDYVDQLKGLEKMENQVYDIIIPDLRQMETTINAIMASINGSSHVKLDVTKWTVRTSLKDIKSLLQKFTQKMSFEIQSNLKRYIDKIDEAFSILIDIYDRIDSYSDSVKQAEYMAHIVSTPMSDIQVRDTELSRALVEMRLMIQSNMLFEKYEIALQAFKQHYFPFAAHVLKRFQLPKGMQLKDIETLRLNIRDKIKDMKSHIDESESTLGEYSKLIHDDNIFNSNTTGASPFYVWKYAAIKAEVQGLLNGSEILIKADITDALDYNSVKFTDIGLNFRFKNETFQNSFNSMLKNFALTMSLIGNNYYRCGEQYYFISFDDDITISYTLNQDETKNWINPNSVYTTIQNSHPFLSPYGLWSIKLKSLDGKASSFDYLKSFSNETIDMELIGRGHYIEQDAGFNFNICNGYLSAFYNVENVAKELV